eukprot:952121-Pleurochrysis_carterae.AAC.4
MGLETAWPHLGHAFAWNWGRRGTSFSPHPAMLQAQRNADAMQPLQESRPPSVKNTQRFVHPFEMRGCGFVSSPQRGDLTYPRAAC